MPPPKNGSLGRGLGDLLGGVPENLGVAGVSRTPLAPPVASKKEEPVESPQDTGAPVRADSPMASPLAPVPQAPVVIERRCWTPARAVMVFVAGIGLLVAGAGLGVWISPRDADVISGRVVVVTNTVEKTVVAEPVAVVIPPALDLTELVALGDQGLNVVVENPGLARVVFGSPVFSSRVSLDPGQAKLLDRIGGVLANHAGDWAVQVIGHTDSIPPRNGGPYRDNVELGLARATEVMRYLLRHTQVPASMVQASTAGEDQPPYPGDDAASRLKNRTVTLLIRAVSK